ncbi:MAG: hypothetical protein MHMPM18_005239 [Marteilia pararefringens]
MKMSHLLISLGPIEYSNKNFLEIRIFLCRMGLKKELTEDERSKIVEKRNEGLSFMQIAKIYGVSKTAVQNTVRRFEETGSNLSRARSGAPRIFTDRDHRRLKRISLNSPSLSSSEISSEFSDQNIDCISAQHVRRILTKMNLRSYVAIRKPFLTRKMKQKRLDFAKKYVATDKNFWDDVYFSDESYIHINLGSVMNRVRRFSTSNPLDSRFLRKTVKFPLKVLVWGCMSSSGLGRMTVCEGNMNSSKYLEVLQNKLLPSIEANSTISPIHLDDSAPAHRTRNVIDWHREKNISKIDWPGNSADLNPIENLWGYLKSKIMRRHITSKRNLIEKIIKIWN